MATKILNLTRAQDAALRAVFGYESSPNGEHGHTRKALKFLEAAGLLKGWWGGNAHCAGKAEVVTHWPKPFIRKLKAEGYKNWVVNREFFESRWPWKK